MGPTESVQTIVIIYYQHKEEIFANLESLQASQAVLEGIFKLRCHPTKMQNDEIHALQSAGASFSTKKCVQEHELVLKQPQWLKYSLFHHFALLWGDTEV